MLDRDEIVMMIYGGGSIIANGVRDSVRAALGNREVHEFGGVEANPQVTTCESAAKAYKDCGATFLLAVGGGSVVDAAKLVAARCGTPDVPAWDIVLDPSRIRKAVPLGVVLTLPATGSEMNTNSVISSREPLDKRGWSSPHVWPKFSILDPTTTLSLPLKYVSNGVVDAFVHVAEQYLTKDILTPIQDRFAEGIMQTLIELGPLALRSSQDYEIRASLMWACTMALNGLIGCGVVQDWASHEIGHELTALYGIDHGRTLAVVLPGVLAHKKSAKFDKLLTFARRVWGLHQGDANVLVDEAIARMTLFFESLGVGTLLEDYGLGKDAAEAVAGRFRMKDLHAGEDRDIDADAVHKILLSRTRG